MEMTIITSGKTIDLAIEAALNQLGLDRDSVSVMVLQQAKAGFLGFGAQPAKVQVTYEAPDPVVEKVPEKPKSALGSASRSKPKAAAPVKKPEERGAGKCCEGRGQGRASCRGAAVPFVRQFDEGKKGHRRGRLLLSLRSKIRSRRLRRFRKLRRESPLPL